MGSRPHPPANRRAGAPSVTSLLLAEQREQPDEDVDEVEVHGHRAVDGVVQGVRDAQRPVEVEDDHRREQHETEPVERGHGAGDGHAEHAEEQDAELPDDEQEQQAEQRHPPGRQALRDERADQTESDDQHGGERQDFSHGRRGVERHHRAEQDAEGDGEHEERHTADERIGVAGRHPGRAERDQEEHQREAEHPPTTHGREPDGRSRPLSGHRRDGDADGGETGDSEQVGAAAHGGGRRVVDAAPYVVVEEAIVGHLSSYGTGLHHEKSRFDNDGCHVIIIIA